MMPEALKARTEVIAAGESGTQDPQTLARMLDEADASREVWFDDWYNGAPD